MSSSRGLSLTLRITLLFASVSTAVLLLLGLLIGTLVERHFEEMDADLLAGKVELVRRALAKGAAAHDARSLPARLDDALVGHDGLALAIWHADGSTLYATPGAAFPVSLRAAATPPGTTPLRWQGHDQKAYRGVSAIALAGAGGEALATVAVAADLSHHEHFMRSFRRALWSVVAAAALLTGLLGWLAARRGLAPLRAICRDASVITADRLHQRLSSASIPAELAEVVYSFNAMLSRLEESFRRLSDFSSDLAHELRTPVSNLMTQTQVTLARTRSLAAYQEVLVSNCEEYERLSRMIADMLFLAKAEHDLMVPAREAVDLAAEAASLCDFYAALADERGIALRHAGAATVAGDRLMLRRALGNLLSNAVRHTPAGGVVSVVCQAGVDGSKVVRVSNDGPAIPPEHLCRLFDRFYRADASRRHGGEGVGLGLAIARSIVRAHGGDISVQSADELTVFAITLPVTPAAPSARHSV